MVLVCRYGGEEFAILLTRTSLGQTAAVGERLVRQVAQLEQGDMSLTLSIGVAAFEQDNFASAVLLFETAVTALYHAKQAGCIRVESADCPPEDPTNILPSQVVIQ